MTTEIMSGATPSSTKAGSTQAERDHQAHAERGRPLAPSARAPAQPGRLGAEQVGHRRTGLLRQRARVPHRGCRELGQVRPARRHELLGPREHAPLVSATASNSSFEARCGPGDGRRPPANDSTGLRPEHADPSTRHASPIGLPTEHPSVSNR